MKYGLSDHSIGYTSYICSVALGASILEKHITIDRNDIGPDHKASMDYAMFKKYVEIVRDAEVCLGDGLKKELCQVNKKIIMQSEEVSGSS